MKFECAFICPEVLMVLGGPEYYPGHESCIYVILKRAPSRVCPFRSLLQIIRYHQFSDTCIDADHDKLFLFDQLFHFPLCL